MTDLVAWYAEHDLQPLVKHPGHADQSAHAGAGRRRGGRKARAAETEWQRSGRINDRNARIAQAALAVGAIGGAGLAGRHVYRVNGAAKGAAEVQHNIEQSGDQWMADMSRDFATSAMKNTYGKLGEKLYDRQYRRQAGRGGKS